MNDLLSKIANGFGDPNPTGGPQQYPGLHQAIGNMVNQHMAKVPPAIPPQMTTMSNITGV